MARANPPIVSFAGGELSPRLWGRVDTSKYATAAKVIENFIPTPHGGVRKRPGTKYMYANKEADETPRFQPFSYGIDQNYMLVFTDLCIRVFTTDGVVVSGPTPVEIVTEYTASEVSELDCVQSANTLFIWHQNHVPAQLTRTSDTSWSLTPLVILRGPWRPLNLDQAITIKANNDDGAVTIEASAALFDALHDGAKFKLYTPGRANGESPFGIETNVNDSEYWTAGGKVYEITGIAGSGGPFKSNFYNPPTHLTGEVRLFASGADDAYADATFAHQGFGIVELDTITNSTTASGDIYEGYGYHRLPLQLVDSSMTGGLSSNARYKEPTKYWQEGAWSDYRGYPGKCAIFEQRMIAAATPTDQQTIYASVTGNYVDFEEGSNDDQALNYTLGSEQADVIRWISSGKALLIGTTAGEYVISSTSQNEALTPTNIKASRETSYGSADVRPVRIGNSVIFGQRNGDPANPARKVREMSYNFDINGFTSIDLTIWAEHITGQGITSLVYQAQPDNLIWAVRTDGRMPCCTYEKEQEVVAWSRHVLGGGGIVEEAACMPGPDGDELWMCVVREIGGNTVRYIERLTVWNDYVDKEDGIFVDCAISYDGSPATVITGASHLNGETVTILADGAVRPDQVVSGGQITLTTAASKVHLGLRYKAILHTLDLEAAAAAGTAQGRSKKVGKVKARVHRSLGGTSGRDADHQDIIQYRKPSGVMDSSPDLKTGDVDLNFDGSWSETGEIRIEHDEPLPFQIIGLFPELNVSG